jgi:hypothetical protein
VAESSTKRNFVVLLLCAIAIAVGGVPNGQCAKSLLHRISEVKAELAINRVASELNKPSR